MPVKKMMLIMITRNETTHMFFFIKPNRALSNHEKVFFIFLKIMKTNFSFLYIGHSPEKKIEMLQKTDKDHLREHQYHKNFQSNFKL